MAKGTPATVALQKAGVAFTLREYLAMLRQLDGHRRVPTLRLAPQAARILAQTCDLLHVTPFSRGHLELLRRDNVPAMNNLPRLLARPLHGLGSALVTPSASAACMPMRAAFGS